MERENERERETDRQREWLISLEKFVYDKILLGFWLPFLLS